MPEMNPIEVMAECIEKCRATTDRDVIAHCISEALGFLQVDEEPENDAFALLGGAIEEAAQEDPVRCAALLESLDRPGAATSSALIDVRSAKSVSDSQRMD